MTISTTYALSTSVEMAPCRAASNSLTDSYGSYQYYNGINNDGNGATITLAGSDFIVDGVTISLRNRVVINLPSSVMNGIYVCTQTYQPSLGYTSAILTRSGDLQSISQYMVGLHGQVQEGLANAGIYFMLGAPIPSSPLGTSTMNIVYSATKASSSTPTSARTTSGVNIQLTSASATYQFINPTANIDVRLPGSPTAGMFFLIKNIPFSVFNITVKDFGGTQIGVVLPNGVSSGYFFDDTAWQVI